jgi:hemerythrin-like domain-containing protein
LAVKLAVAEEVSPQEVREVAGRIRRYFGEALPKHTRDEDESIVPRLAGKEPEVDAVLSRMGREHLQHEAHVAQLVALCAQLENSPEQLAELRTELGRVAQALEAEFSSHLAEEERVVLPAIRRLLSMEEQASLLSEFRERRAAL